MPADSSSRTSAPAPAAQQVTPDRDNDTGPPAPPEVAAPHIAGDHAPVLHTATTLPAPTGYVPRELHKVPLDNQRKNALALFNFLKANDPLLLKLNDGDMVFTALINIPKSKWVKVLHCAGIGSSPIGVTPSPIDGKILFLHGDGNAKLGPATLVALPKSVANMEELAVMIEEQFTATLTTKGAAYHHPLLT